MWEIWLNWCCDSHSLDMWMFTLYWQHMDGAVQHQMGIFAYCLQQLFLTADYFYLLKLYMTEVCRCLYHKYTYLDYVKCISSLDVHCCMCRCAAATGHITVTCDEMIWSDSSSDWEMKAPQPVQPACLCRQNLVFLKQNWSDVPFDVIRMTQCSFVQQFVQFQNEA